MKRPITRGALVAALTASLAGCGVLEGEGSGEAEIVTVPSGASFSQVTDSLSAHGLLEYEPVFKLYARFKGADASVKAGTYAFKPGAGWNDMLEDLREGRVITQRLTLPEAIDLRDVAPRIAQIVDMPADSILALLGDSAFVAEHQLPGPTAEGYLYPATYTFPLRVPLDTVLRRLTETYKKVWTPERRALADAIGLSEREVVTLASIVEKEARVPSEMPRIASVYHNRLDIGMPLQADPTVQYALGVHRERLLYAAIDSVADNPYNTYRNRGLPPGPIASPSAPAIDAVLQPDSTDFLYFVAAPDGSHIFTRSLAEHNRAKQQVRRAGADTTGRRPAAPDPS